ncbi:hypothetical protein CJ030_MR7G011671 [Morella rubra]|uniref:PB1-like domain-containing protein n=1 Tax=Morella rubra TaxID=262757 RepID=A0A6A1V285_9ROSI|nr:hypothetical protein CJ030_MR7G011671 [Morella rubra]
MEASTTKMVKIYLHHGGKLSWVSGNYVRREVVYAGNFDLDYLSVTHLWKFIKKDLKYHELVDLWCYFDGKPFEGGINSLESTLIFEHEALQIYVEHKLSVPEEVPLYSLPPIQNTGEGDEEEGKPVGDGEDEGEGAQAHVAKEEGEGDGEGLDADDEADVRGLDNARLEPKSSDFEEIDEVPELFGDPKVVNAEEVQTALVKGREKAQGKRPVVEEEHAHVEATVEKGRVSWNGLV